MYGADNKVAKVVRRMVLKGAEWKENSKQQVVSSMSIKVHCILKFVSK